MKYDYDVIIIGAGVAGALCTWRLAQDKREVFRDRPFRKEAAAFRMTVGNDGWGGANCRAKRWMICSPRKN
jgi:glycine/D-amino acid oxidase-like deaminating enzyme